MSSKDQVGNAALILLVICALVLTGISVRREFVTPSSAPRSVHVDSWRQYAAGGQHFGSTNGKVVLVEFSDFQCPFCRLLTDSLNKVLHTRKDVSVVFHQFPLEGHPFAELAAESSECAARQGAFEAYHDRLFAERDSIGHKSWAAFASAAGVRDTVAFNACVKSGEMAPIVAADKSLGNRLGVTGTPTFIINGDEYGGVPPNLAALIEKAAKGD